MFEAQNYDSLGTAEFWAKAAQDLDNLLSRDDSTITTLANSAAFLYYTVSNVNWVGYYLFDREKLILGPFCGKPACTTISIGKGVCGTAALRREVVVVDDVHTFPGHIVCDLASRSEIVLPLVIGGKLVGVLDIDSPLKGRFEPDDTSGLTAIVRIIESKIGRPDVLL